MTFLCICICINLNFIIYFKPFQKDRLDIDKIPVKKGIGYYENDFLIMTPKDFSVKSKYSIRDQHEFLKNLMF